MKKKLLLTVLAIFLLTASVQAARGRHPQFAAQKGIDKVTALSQKFSNIMLTKADRVASKITDLLIAGDIELAQQLADHAVNRILRLRNRSLNIVNRLCKFYYWKLNAAGLTDLADQVAAACAEANDLLRDSADQAIATINAAFDGGEPGE